MKRAERRLDRHGFTLLELTVALAVGGLALAGAHSVFGQLGDATQHITAAAIRADREANTERVLRALFFQAEVAEHAPLQGIAQGVRFTTQCEEPTGVAASCRVSLGIVRVNGEPVLALSTSGGGVAPLRRGFREGGLAYLRSAEGGGSWTTTWSSTIALPLAVGVVLDGDTTLYRIGERG